MRVSRRNFHPKTDKNRLPAIAALRGFEAAARSGQPRCPRRYWARRTPFTRFTARDIRKTRSPAPARSFRRAGWRCARRLSPPPAPRSTCGSVLPRPNSLGRRRKPVIWQSPIRPFRQLQIRSPASCLHRRRYNERTCASRCIPFFHAQHGHPDREAFFQHFLKKRGRRSVQPQIRRVVKVRQTS